MDALHAPTTVAGHSVANINHYSVGNHFQTAAFISSSSLVSVVSPSFGQDEGPSSRLPAKPMAVLSVYPLSATCVTMHPTAPVMAVGTKEGWVIVVDAYPNAATWTQVSAKRRSLSALLAAGADRLEGAPAGTAGESILVPSVSGPTSVGFALWSGSEVTSVAFSLADPTSNRLSHLAALSSKESSLQLWNLMAAQLPNQLFYFKDADRIVVPHSATSEMQALGVLRHIAGAGGGEFALCGSHNAAFASVKGTAVHGWSVELWKMQPLPADATAKSTAAGEVAEFTAVSVPPRNPKEGVSDTFVFALLSTNLLVCFSATSGGATKWVDCRFSSTTTSAASKACTSVGIQCTPNHVFVQGANVARCFTLTKWEIVDSLKVTDALVLPDGSGVASYVGGLLLGGASAVLFSRLADGSSPISIIPLAPPNALVASKPDGSKAKVKYFLPSRARTCAIPMSSGTPMALVQFSGPAPDRLPLIQYSQAAVRLHNPTSMLAMGEAYPSLGGAEVVASVCYHPLLDMILVLLVGQATPNARSQLGRPSAARVIAYCYDPLTTVGDCMAETGSVAFGNLSAPYNPSKCAIAAKADSAVRPDTRFVCATSLMDSSVVVHFMDSTFNNEGPLGRTEGVVLSLLGSRQIAYSALLQSNFESQLFQLAYCGDSPWLILPTGAVSLDADDETIRFAAGHRGWHTATQHVTCVAASSSRLVLATSDPCALLTCEPASKKIFPLQSTTEGTAASSMGDSVFEAVAVDSRMAYIAVVARTDSFRAGGALRSEWHIVLYSTSAMREVVKALVCAATVAVGHERGAGTYLPAAAISFSPVDDNIIHLHANGTLMRYDVDDLLKLGASHTATMPASLPRWEPLPLRPERDASPDPPARVVSRVPPIDLSKPQGPRKAATTPRGTSTGAPRTSSAGPSTKSAVPPIPKTSRVVSQSPIITRAGVERRPMTARAQTARRVATSNDSPRPSTAADSRQRAMTPLQRQQQVRAGKIGISPSASHADLEDKWSQLDALRVAAKGAAHKEPYAAPRRPSAEAASETVIVVAPTSKMERYQQLEFAEVLTTANDDSPVQARHRELSAMMHDQEEGNGGASSGPRPFYHRLISPEMNSPGHNNGSEAMHASEDDTADILRISESEEPVNPTAPPDQGWGHMSAIPTLTSLATSEATTKGSVPSPQYPHSLEGQAATAASMHLQEPQYSSASQDISPVRDRYATSAAQRRPSHEGTSHPSTPRGPTVGAHHTPEASNSPLAATAASSRPQLNYISGSLVNVSQLSEESSPTKSLPPAFFGRHADPNASNVTSTADPAKVRRLDFITARRSAAMQNVLAILKSMEKESQEFEHLRREVGVSSMDGSGVIPSIRSEEEADRSLETWSEINRLLHEELRRETLHAQKLNY